ncbi:hypothetical protein ASC90_26515 [Rhizobium sp. Root1220]|nr:hypothetical protein ASC90_26515 [Rhizobium sp. Root1220]
MQVIKYVWTLERDKHEPESGMCGLNELGTVLKEKAWHGVLPVEWIVEIMDADEHADGSASHHHDVRHPQQLEALLGETRESCSWALTSRTLQIAFAIAVSTEHSLRLRSHVQGR